MCPKCKGRVVPEDSYDTPAVKCLNCGWMKQQPIGSVEMRPVGTTPNLQARLAGSLGGRPRQPPKPPKVLKEAPRVLVGTMRSKTLHLLRDKKYMVSYCGIRNMKTPTGVEGRNICTNCEKSYAAHRRKR